MSQIKLDHWLATQALPQRLLLSGSGDLWPLALSTAAKLLQQGLKPLAAGLEADVKLCPDDQQTIRIGDRQSPDPLSVRGLIKWLNHKPVASHRILVLQNIERTSRDAMQAWLKILEEPPARAQFILTTKNHHQLPTTILSRATVLPISAISPEIDSNTKAHAFLSTTDLITQFQIVDDLDKSQKDDPQATKVFITNLLEISRQLPPYHPLLPILFEAHQDLSRNVNRRLVLEHLAITLQNR